MAKTKAETEVDADFERLFLAHMLMATTAIRILVRTGIIPKQDLVAELGKLGNSLRQDPAAGAALADAEEAVRNMPDPLS